MCEKDEKREEEESEELRFHVSVSWCLFTWQWMLSTGWLTSEKLQLDD